MNQQKITKMQKILITDSTIFVADIDLFLVELNLKVIKNVRINSKVVMILTIFPSVHKI